MSRRLATLQRVSTAQSYRNWLPVPPLGREIACVWAQQVAARGPADEQRTAPDGCEEIPHAVGSDVVAVGVRLRRGAATSILGWPPAEMVDLHLAPDELWNRRATPLAGPLTAKGSPDAAAGLLDEEILRDRIETAAADPVVDAAVERRQPWRVDGLARLAGEAGYADQLHSTDHDASYSEQRCALLAARLTGDRRRHGSRA